MGAARVGISVGALYCSIHHKHIFFSQLSSVWPVLLIDMNKYLADYVSNYFKQNK